ncbi:MAG: hypothetical protein KGN84_21805 [Acidobacteriota bacterium]|nr:hypothetical protein [Acidobacteriota bacterium]
MHFRNMLMTGAAIAAGLAVAALSADAQGPLYDQVIVDLPYAVTVNNTVLQPGHYVIRQMDDAGVNSGVLMIFSDNGMKLRTTSLTIPALKTNTPEKTSVVLHHIGGDYYFDQMWIEGKNYGYEFPLPPSVKMRQREEMKPYTVAATYAPAAKKDETPEVARNTKPAAPAPPPSPEPAAQPQPMQEAMNTPPPAPAPVPVPISSAPAMPHTAGNWLQLMLSGGVLSGAGIALRRLAG